MSEMSGSSVGAHVPPPPPPPPPPGEYSYYVRHAPAARPAPPATPEAETPSEASPAGPPMKALGVRFSLFGIPIHLNLSFLLVGLVLGYGPGRSPALVFTLVGLIALSVLWHELAHALALKLFGFDSEIRLLGFFGVTLPRGKEAVSDAQMLVVAAAGPIAGLLLAGACRAVMPPASPFQPNSILEDLMVINLFISLANLLPMFPLDGGRIMKSLVHMAAPRRSETIVSAISLVVGGSALWYSMNHDLQFTSLILLGLLALNFATLRAGGRPGIVTR